MLFSILKGSKFTHAHPHEQKEKKIWCKKETMQIEYRVGFDLVLFTSVGSTQIHKKVLIKIKIIRLVHTHIRRHSFIHMFK